MKIDKKTLLFAFVSSLPIFFSYEFLSIAFGIMMYNAGYNFIWSWLVSKTVYTGAFQYVLVDYLKTGTPFITIILTAVFMNSRMLFYGISYIEKFRKTGKFYPYMIFSLTDETYALYCSMDGGKNLPKGINETLYMLYVAIMARVYWLTGTIIGGLLGGFLKFDFTGIDFCMTALFVTILIDKWKAGKDRKFAIRGLVCGTFSLFIFGAKSFIFPAMMFTMLLLIVERKFSNKGLGDNV